MPIKSCNNRLLIIMLRLGCGNAPGAGLCPVWLGKLPAQSAVVGKSLMPILGRLYIYNKYAKKKLVGIYLIIIYLIQPRRLGYIPYVTPRLGGICQLLDTVEYASQKYFHAPDNTVYSCIQTRIRPAGIYLWA